MAQKIINVGTVANDGTGDTIRGAFTNVNANFTEVYGNISSLTAIVDSIDLDQNITVQTSFDTTNVAFNTANAAFGKSNLTYGVINSAFTVANAAYNNANVGFAAANSYANAVGLAGNNYASILAANNAVGANAWANTISSSIGAAGNNFTLSTFTTLSNTSIVYNTANASFDKSNLAFQNTSGTFAGNLRVSGTATSLGGFTDAVGSVRERFAILINTSVTANSAHLTYISNSASTLQIRIPDDNAFVLAANVGTTIDIYQFGTGDTSIIANDAAVTVHSSNNWANIAGQYLSATAVKVLPNTWILTGDLKA